MESVDDNTIIEESGKTRHLICGTEKGKTKKILPKTIKLQVTKKDFYSLQIVHKDHAL